MIGVVFRIVDLQGQITFALCKDIDFWANVIRPYLFKF